MLKFRNIVRLFLLLSFVVSSDRLWAVTDAEMEQARVIAAKSYIRYVNDGSGYLDEFNPKTLNELEALLKPKEKENIKAFLAIPVPSDYKNWDKQKLVEYWAVTAYQDKGLEEKGRGGRIRTRSLINKMDIAPVSATQPAETPAADNAAETAAAKPVSPEAEVGTAPVDSLATGEDPVIKEDLDGFEEPEIDKATNYTWVYIVALAILVALVIALIVYAAKVMKTNGSQNSGKYPSEEEGEDFSEIREKLEAAVADKDIEIAMLTKKLESANRLNVELKARLEGLSAEVAALQRETKPVVTDNFRVVQETEPKKTPLRSIYLGRANAKGIFIRADRTLNVGNSVFILETGDGYSGTFRVADSQAAWSLALSNPTEYLAAACVITNPEAAPAASRIITESAGTAIFEGGCWRVIRKAKVRFQ